MVIYAVGFPEKWFGNSYVYKDMEGKHHQITIEGLVNGNSLVAQNSEGKEYFNLQAFALGLLQGVIQPIQASSQTPPKL